MKCIIEGFNQEVAVNMGLDVKDLVLLRGLIELELSRQFPIVKDKGKWYFGVNYLAMINYLPILQVKSKNSIFNRMEKLCRKKILYSLASSGYPKIYRFNEKKMILLVSK